MTVIKLVSVAGKQF